METKSLKRLGSLSFVLFVGLSPAHAQFGNFVKKVKEKAEKVVKDAAKEVTKEVTDEVQQQAKVKTVGGNASNLNAATLQKTASQALQSGGIQGANADPMTIMRQVQIPPQTPDNFYALARQSDNGGAFNPKLSVRAQYEALAFYLLRLKKAVEQRDIETMAWSDDNKAALYYEALRNNAKRSSVQDFSWQDWGTEYLKVAAAVDKIMLAPFNGSSTRSLLSRKVELHNILNYLQTPGLSSNQQKYYLSRAVEKLHESLVEGTLQDADADVQTMVASLKTLYGSMDQDYQAHSPMPMTLAEARSARKAADAQKIQQMREDFQKEQDRVREMHTPGKMNTPELLAIYTKLVKQLLPNEHFVKFMIESDKWQIDNDRDGMRRRVYGCAIAKLPDGRYRAYPYSIAAKWIVEEGKYSNTYRISGRSHPYYVNYK